MPPLHSGVVGAGVNDVVGQVDEQLGEATLGCGIVAQDGAEGGVAEGLGETLAQGLTGAGVITQAQEAAHHVLQEPRGLLLDQLSNHIAQNCTDGVEPLVGSANVVQAVVVQQDLLHDEDGDRLAELRAGLHDAQAKGDDLGGKEEVDHLSRVILNQRADNSEGGQAQILERTGLGRRVQEGVEEERDVSCEWEYGISDREKIHDRLQAREGGGSTIPFKNNVRVSLWEATHCSSARALQTLLEAAAVSCDGLRRL